MKLGFWTGNKRDPWLSGAAKTDRFLNFTMKNKDGMLTVVQFFNQSNPTMAVQMLRQLADEIEKEAA